MRLAEQLRDSLPAADENLRKLAAVAARHCNRTPSAWRRKRSLPSSFIPDTQILSIGYDARSAKSHEACYDMLASEARIATFLAVARGDLPQESWFKLAREHAYAFGHFLLLSWTGTMFEYLMPALWMRSYPRTRLLRALQAACVMCSAHLRASLSIPWGISESGAARKDDAGHYSLPGLWRPAIALWF